MRLLLIAVILLPMTLLAGIDRELVKQAVEIDKTICAMAQQEFSGLSQVDFEAIDLKAVKQSSHEKFIFSKPKVSKSDDKIKMRPTYKLYMRDGVTREIGCKMKSLEAIEKKTGLTPVRDEPTCKEINAKIFEIGKSLIPDEYDPQFEFLDDEVMPNGLKWTKAHLVFGLGGEAVQIQSPALRTKLDITPKFAGMRYCKLLSVSRVVHHILINIFFEL